MVKKIVSKKQVEDDVVLDLDANSSDGESSSDSSDSEEEVIIKPIKKKKIINKKQVEESSSNSDSSDIEEEVIKKPTNNVVKKITKKKSIKINKKKDKKNESDSDNEYNSDYDSNYDSDTSDYEDDDNFDEKLIRGMTDRDKKIKYVTEKLKIIKNKGWPIASKETADVYIIENLQDGLRYVGTALSYVKNGKIQNYEWGAKERFNQHFRRAFNNDKDTKNDCPHFYKAIRQSGNTKELAEKKWDYTVLIRTARKKRKYVEKILALAYETYKKEYGHNDSVGDEKPPDGERRIEYELKKARGNKNRAMDGAMKRNEDSVGLPANITPKYQNGDTTKNVIGYRAQIKIADVKAPLSRSFMSTKLTLSEKLDLAILQLAEYKKFEADRSYKYKKITKKSIKEI
jgi:hypothetical protein